MAALLLYGIPYAALFVLALRMPGWRSLATLAVILALPLGWLAWVGFRSAERAPGGAGLGILMGTLLVCSAMAGLLAGAATRGLMLWRPLIGQSRMRSTLLVLAGLLAMPAFLAGSSWLSERDRRLPDAACLTARHHVTIAGADLWLPSAPVFTPWTDGKTLYPFSTHQGMRAFCGIGLGAKKPVRLVNLSVDVKELRFTGRPLREKFCASGQRDLAKLLCNIDASAPHSSHGFPEQLSIHSPAEYDHRRMLASGGGTHAAFIRESKAAEGSGQALRASEAGEFIRYSDRYWVARDRTWTNDAGEPYTLSCYDTPPAGMLYCTTTYLLASGPQVTYRFRAPQDELASVAKLVDANVHVLLDILTPG